MAGDRESRPVGGVVEVDIGDDCRLCRSPDRKVSFKMRSCIAVLEVIRTCLQAKVDCLLVAAAETCDVGTQKASASSETCSKSCLTIK